MEIVEINGVEHLKIGNSYYDSNNAELLIRIGENTIKAYQNTSHSQESEVLTHAK